MQFLKVQGVGNDFVLINRLVAHGEEDWPRLARQMCDRHFGIGADGLVLILRSSKADLRMRIFNPDGSEAEMCGNAIRCVARYAYENQLITHNTVHVETLAGLRIPEIVFDNQGQYQGVKVDMGAPILEPSLIPTTGVKEKIIAYPLPFSEGKLMITAVSMGNPHCITFVLNLAEVPFYTWGPAIETHPLFPQKTNVEFVEVIKPSEVRMRVWERGAGETLGCGTGACAVAVAGFLNHLTEREITVHLPGGDLLIEWAENQHVYMTGPAEKVFAGTWPLV